MSLLRFDGSDDGFGRQGQVADAYAEGGVNGIRDRGGGGALCSLTRTERGLTAGDQVYVDAWCRGEPEDGVALPVGAGDPAAVEAHPLDRGPAGRLHGAAGQLVTGTVGVDDQAEVGGDGEPAYPDLALGLYLRDDRAPRALVLVAGEAAAPPPGVGELVAPTGLARG